MKTKWKEIYDLFSGGKMSKERQYRLICKKSENTEKEKEENKNHCLSWLHRDSPKHNLQYLYFYVDRYFKNGIMCYKLPYNIVFAPT